MNIENSFQAILKTATKEAKRRGYDMYIISNEKPYEFGFSQDKNILLVGSEALILVVTPEGNIKSIVNK